MRTLRATLAAYLRRVRGAAVDPAQVVVCAGYAQGSLLVLRALAEQGLRELAVSVRLPKTSSSAGG